MKPHKNELRETGDTYGARDTAKRRDEALKRALNTPPTPHKSDQRKLAPKKPPKRLAETT